MNDVDRLFEGVAQRAGALDDIAGRPMFATVESYNPAQHTAKVTLQPEGVLTGWLPIVTPTIGNGWGLVSGLVPGTQVLVLPHENNPDHNVIVGAVPSLAALPPKVQSAPYVGSGAPTSNVQAGETLLVNSFGAVIRLCADGSVFIKGGTVNVQGDVHVLGDIYDKHGSLDALRQTYNTHDHSDPQGGTTGLPNQISPEGDGSGGFA